MAVIKSFYPVDDNYIQMMVKTVYITTFIIAVVAIIIKRQI